MAMPKNLRKRYWVGLAVGGAVVAASSATPATVDAKRPPNTKVEPHAASVHLDRKPPNG